MNICRGNAHHKRVRKMPRRTPKRLQSVAARPDPSTPGPFAFAEASRVRSILSDAGFSVVTATPLDSPVGGTALERTLKLALRLGPLGAALRQHPELEPLVVGPVREALRNYLTAGGVRSPGATWISSARKVSGADRACGHRQATRVTLRTLFWHHSRLGYFPSSEARLSICNVVSTGLLATALGTRHLIIATFRASFTSRQETMA